MPLAPESRTTARALSAEDLLAGASATFTVDVPGSVLGPSDSVDAAGTVVLRPLTLRDIQRITQAAKEQKVLASVLMIQQSLVKPKLTVEQAGALPAGLAEFLLEKVNYYSGLSLRGDDVEQAVRAPLARACFVLSREFGWSPEECSSLTLGQILLYLEMLAQRKTTEVSAP